MILDDKKFLFIIGAPRSGTTWLQLMLGAHPNVVTTVELTTFNEYIAPLVHAWDGNKRINDNIAEFSLPFLFTDEEFEQIISEFLRKINEKVLYKKPSATHILGKHPGITDHIQLIKKYHPKAKFIHIIRDGRDAALSAVKTRETAGFGASTILQAGQIWRHLVTAGQQANIYSGDYLEVRYEELHEDTVKLMRVVYDFCGLEIDNAEIQNIVDRHQFKLLQKEARVADDAAKAPIGHYRKGKIGSWKEELKPYDLYLISAVCNSLLLELGYIQCHNWWAQGPYQRLVMPLRFRAERLSKLLLMGMRSIPKAINLDLNL